MSFTKYCTTCGEELIRIPVPAEKAKVLDYGFGDCAYFPLGSKFDKHTGLRQFGIRVKCPNKKWYNRHTDYID